MTTTPMKLTDLPTELIEEILILCDPVEVGKVAQTCSAMRSFIYHSPDCKLWRELYLLQDLDDPRICVGHDGTPKPLPIRWMKDLQRIIRARTVVEDVSMSSLQPAELEEVLQTLLMLTCFVRPLTSDERWHDEEISKNLVWVAANVKNGFLDRLQERSTTFAERQLAARLHTYFGLTKYDARKQNIVKSRAYVYLLRNYRPENEYGPFLPNGTVNWEHMRAIHHVVSTHLVELGQEDEDEFEYAIFPMALPFTQIVVPRGQDSDVDKDWAGITGSWNVSFCFCDHRELLRFNEDSATKIDTSLFERPDFHEVYRSLDVKLCVARTEHDPDHPTRPILYFFGQMHNPSTSTMTGRVKMTPDNQVQWHFVSGDQGNAIWSSEGIQVGGLRSSFGVLGSWTTIFHDPDDPVGPFWVRKHKHGLFAGLEEDSD